MKYIFLACCFLFSVQQLCAQKNFKKKKGAYSYTNPDGNRETGMLANHLQEGEWITYYGKTKDIKLKTAYVHGEATGRTEEYDRSGKLTASGYYRDGYADSVWTYYYSTGEVSETRTYSKGKLHGELKHYAPDGIVFKYYRFEQNEMKAFEAFDYTGKPLMGEYYSNGQKNGRCWNTKGWDKPDETHRNYCDYVKDKMHGEQKSKEIQGTGDVVIQHWKNGVLEGPCMLYTEEGDFIEEGNYQNGYAIGYWKVYDRYSDKKLAAEYWFSPPTAEDSLALRFYKNKLLCAEKQFPDSVKFYLHDGQLRDVDRRQPGNIYISTHIQDDPEPKGISPKFSIDHVIPQEGDEPLLQFPGGNDALSKYMEEHVQYPKAAYDAGIQGTVYVHFNVDRDGKVIHAEIAKSVHPILDKEAVRVVMQMPNWIVGHNGEGANGTYMQPISFKLK